MSTTCPDGGTCHHGCRRTCFRRAHCEPLSGVFPDEQWPVEPRPTFEEWCANEFTEGAHVADALRRYADRGREEFLEVLTLAGEAAPPKEWKLPVVLVIQRGAVVPGPVR